jgi:hypothetical protein
MHTPLPVMPIRGFSLDVPSLLCLLVYIHKNVVYKSQHNWYINMGVKEKPDIIDIIERKRLQWNGHVKRM